MSASAIYLNSNPTRACFANVLIFKGNEPKHPHDGLLGQVYFFRDREPLVEADEGDAPEVLARAKAALSEGGL